jgi:hypothetical protein
MLIFKNKPDTTTPINADNLNVNFQECKNKSAILVALSSNTELTASTAWATLYIPFNTTVYKIGNGFNLESDGGVSVDSNVTGIKVTFYYQLAEDCSQAVYGRIYDTKTGMLSKYNGSIQKTTDRFMITHGILNTTGSNKIYGSIASGGTPTIKIKGKDMYTYMLVEEL